MARGPFVGLGPTEKSRDFGPSARRLLGRLAPERAVMSLVLTLSVSTVVLGAFGPRLLGHATNVIFDGLLGRRLPAGLTKEQAVASARAAGNDKLADLYAKSGLVPGHGIDFSALGRVLVLVLGLYLASSLCAWLQGYLLTGVVQRTVYRLREDIEGKLNRLPLAYFDRQPRGEVLSRVTNDIDNVSQSLQQSLSQILISLMTVLAVLTMMVLISPLLAVIALVSVPVAVLLSGVVFTDPKGASRALVTDQATQSYDCFGGPGISQVALLAAWAPGGLPTDYPSNVGAPLDAGTLLVMQVHYHPHQAIDSLPSDQTHFQMRLVSTAPQYVAYTILPGNFRAAVDAAGNGLLPGPDDPAAGLVFVIPAGASAHTETMQFTLPRTVKNQALPASLQIFSIWRPPTLRGVGRAGGRDHVKPPAGTDADQCLLAIPHWDFDWQRLYRYDAPVRAAAHRWSRRRHDHPLHVRQHAGKRQARRVAARARAHAAAERPARRDDTG